MHLHKKVILLFYLLALPSCQISEEGGGAPAVFSTLEAARRAELKAGDVICLRDFSLLAGPEAASFAKTAGRWQLRPYQLDNGEEGAMLFIQERVLDQLPGVIAIGPDSFQPRKAPRRFLSTSLAPSRS